MASRSHRPLPLVVMLGVAAAILGAAAPRFVTLNSLAWPPFFADDPQRPGFARELIATCIERQTRTEPRFSPLPEGQMYQALKSGALDGYVFPFEESRGVFVVYGRVPLFIDSVRPVVRAGSDFAPASFADLDALRVGAARGLGGGEQLAAYLQRRRGAGTLLEASDATTLVDALLRGEIDVALMHLSLASSEAQRRGIGNRIAIRSWELTYEDLYFVISKASTRIAEPREFLDEVDACLQQMKENGQYQQLAARYGLP